MPRFALGRLKQAQDKRDHIVRYFKRIHSPTASLAGLAGPFLNQESLGSCGPSSAVKVIRILQKIQGVEEFTAARLAIYYNTRKRMDTIAEDSGVDNRSMCKSLASDGYCHEELYPYNILNFTQPPSETCYAEGRENKVSSYATLPVDLDSIKACLDGSHKPYVLGLKVYKSMLTDEVAETGNVPNPGVLETEEGGHDVVGLGFTDVDTTFIGRSGKVWAWKGGTILFDNHWLKEDGTLWGMDGMGTLPYEYVTNPNLTEDCWVFNEVVEALTHTVYMPYGNAAA